MPRKNRSTSARRPSRRPDATTLLLRAELAELRQLVGMLQVESLTHLRRIGELQQDIDTLKKASAPPTRQRVRSVRPDGRAAE